MRTRSPARVIGSVLLIAAVIVSSAAIAAKKAPASDKGAQAASGKAPGELSERIIEKKDGDYILRLTIRPGNLKLNEVGEGEAELLKALEIPDPETGDTRPIANANAVARVKQPEGAPARGKKSSSSEPTRYRMWPAANPGTYSFHFTPTDDGIYEVTISGTDPVKSGDDAAETPFTATFRVGAGNAAAQTESSQSSTSARKTTRRPLGGGGDDKASKLTQIMREIGNRYYEATKTNDAAEVKAMAVLFEQVRGLVPESNSDGASEFDSLAAKAESTLADFGGKAKGKPGKSLESIEPVSCDQCHAKYRFQVTTDVSDFPKFAERVVAL